MLACNLDTLEMIKFVCNRIDDNYRWKHDALHPKVSCSYVIVKNVNKTKRAICSGRDAINFNCILGFVNRILLSFPLCWLFLFRFLMTINKNLRKDFEITIG